MEHVERYRDRHFWAWTEKDGVNWKGCLAFNGTLETCPGVEHKDEAQVLQAVIELARTRLEALLPAAAAGALP